MNELTIDQLVTIERALTCYANTHIRRAAYYPEAASLEYVLTGGENKPVVKAREVMKIIGDEIERRKGGKCEPAKT